MKGNGFEPALLIATGTQKALLSALRAEESRMEEGAVFRLAMINPTPERIARAEKIIAKGKSVHGLQDIWYSQDALLQNGGKLAFMYPGIDSLLKPEVVPVAEYFGIPYRAIESADSLESRGAEVFHISDVYTRILRKLRLQPDLMFGHSLGEWSGIVASGLTVSDTVDSVLETLGPGMLPVPGVVFAALGCSYETALDAIQNLPRIELSHDNCPHQSIICGDEASVDAAIAILSIKKIMAQKLDFKSGFHTSLFKDYIGPLQKNIQAMIFSEPRVPLWSATTCAPYPSDETALRHLLVQHLLEPVRFRELTKTLYEQGVRVFLQVGAGSLPGFINDTLRGTPHLCLSMATPNRSGLSVLQKSCLALFVEGAIFDWERILPEALQPEPEPNFVFSAAETEVVPMRAETVGLDLLAELEACFADIQLSTREVLAAMEQVRPFAKSYQKTLTLRDRPELMDHCFYKQKKGWKNISDLFPVMPMTATIDLIIKLGGDLFPDRKVIAVESISATKWLSVEEPKSIELKVDYDGKGRLKVEISGHFALTVVLGAAYSHSPESQFETLINPRMTSIDPKTVYEEGYLFHGPRYQGVEDLPRVGDDGIQGIIQVKSVPGALLDNVGQIAGLWIMQALSEDKYAMPIRIKRIDFYGAEPKSGLVTCNVRTVRVRARDIMFKMELVHEGRIWATISGWEKWRFECDDTLWSFLLKPGISVLSSHKEGFSFFEREYFSDTIADDLAKRYLREAERKVYSKLGRHKQSWICGRVAAKDAVRQYLWTNGHKGPIYPAEIWIENDANGKPYISELPGDFMLNVTISHKPGMGVASVSPMPGIGIDIEKIETRERGFATTVFTPSEMDMIPSENSSEWITRFWGAKEAFAKSTGLGLQGDPRQFPIESVSPSGIQVKGSLIRSTKVGAYIISQKEG
ncbi:MAG: 4'-phosphopantetheinyl transferase superfamily protein [Bdellovibrionota bacterium]